MVLTEILFWTFFGVVFYTYLGYGVLLFVLVWIKERLIFKPEAALQKELEFPEISLLIPAYNEESVVQSKMENTLKLNYPDQKLKILWITDGSTDLTNEILTRNYPQAKLLFKPKRGGKTAAINRAMKHINTPIVVFTDANTMLNSDALVEIARAFEDSNVGCVAGEKRVKSKESDGAASSGEGIYWRYESYLKMLDSRLNTTVGAAGELFAIRTSLYEEMENDTLLDDFILSMKIVLKGYKIEYCKNAYAIESGSANIDEERKRKVRISAGGIQSIIRLKQLFNLIKYPLLTFQYISHRVLRWSLTPICLFLILPTNIALVIITGNAFYFVLLLFQIIFYASALIGKNYSDRQIKHKVFYVPYYFLFMNYNVILGFSYYLRKSKGDGTWEKAKRA